VEPKDPRSPEPVIVAPTGARIVPDLDGAIDRRSPDPELLHRDLALGLLPHEPSAWRWPRPLKSSGPEPPNVLELRVGDLVERARADAA
jgi:hypothetical protein